MGIAKNICSRGYISITVIVNLVKWVSTNRNHIHIIEDVSELALQDSTLNLAIMRVDIGRHTGNGSGSFWPKVETPFLRVVPTERHDIKAMGVHKADWIRSLQPRPNGTQKYRHRDVTDMISC